MVEVMLGRVGRRRGEGDGGMVLAEAFLVVRGVEGAGRRRGLGGEHGREARGGKERHEATVRSLCGDSFGTGD
jgi:hypothetical protein